MVNAEGTEELLGVTEEHPFWVENKGWINAGELQEGYKISSVSGNTLTVKTVVVDDQLHDTYNFEVADYHTYFVGESGAWVHNICWNPLPAHKLWSKGKLGRHSSKHGAGFGAKSAKEYSELATKFGQRTDVLSGKIKTFYKWDGR